MKKLHAFASGFCMCGAVVECVKGDVPWAIVLLGLALINAGFAFHKEAQ